MLYAHEIKMEPSHDLVQLQALVSAVLHFRILLPEILVNITEI
jgi:hypothetical protein